MWNSIYFLIGVSVLFHILALVLLKLNTRKLYWIIYLFILQFLNLYSLLIYFINYNEMKKKTNKYFNNCIFVIVQNIFFKFYLKSEIIYILF